jgi:hypothetical protein
VATLDALVPDRTVVADTVTVLGSAFGTTPSDASVRFAAGSDRVEAVVVAWSATEVRVVVPATATDGEVTVETPAGTSNGLGFEVAPAHVAYSQVDAIFENRGCKGCHGASGGLSVADRASLLAGDSNHGPVVRPRRSGDSVLIQKLGSSPPFGDRMPQGGPPLLDVEILTIADWIDQGARAD